MKKLLVIVHVFGQYQDYIPLFVLAWLKAYPYVDIRIYLQDNINPNIQEQLELLDISGHVTIVENYCSLVSLTEKALKHGQIAKCVRWLIYEPVFEEYEAVYIGDIDIVIAKEKESLFDQHIRHCKRLNLPYSNILRVKKLRNPLDFVSFLRNVCYFGVRNAIQNIYRGKSTLKQLSGLHFYRTAQYLPAIRAVSEKFTEYLNLMGNSGRGPYTICSFNNEAFLHDMVEAAGFRLPNDSSGKPYQMDLNPETEAFRPHHGVHLGIFRGNQVVSGRWNELLGSEIYREYYKDFLELSEIEDYKKLEACFSGFIKEQIQGLHDFMNRTDSKGI